LLQIAPETLLAPGVFPILFLGLWAAVTGLIAVLGGWQALSAEYRAPDDFVLAPEDRFRMRSLQLRTVPLLPARYKGCITLGVTSRGLYLRPMVFFRLFHPPLLIPWTAVDDLKDGHFLWSQWTDIVLRGHDTRLRLFGGVGDLVRTEWRAHQLGRPAA
jgi:hypothetical protein